jgi:tripartite-type tricarboxylate transporter receptor subunit TctC
MLTRRALLCGLMTAGAILANHDGVFGEDYPSRTVKIVVPFPAGGPTDVTARVIAERLEKRLGQSVIVENRPGGGGGTIGAKSVATSEPDGYTLLFALVGTLTIAPAVYKNSGYEPLKNFAPVAMVATGTMVLAVHPSLPVKSVAELVAYAKANPGKVSYASPGFGTLPHLLGEMFRTVTGTEIFHVPYRGSAPAVTDFLAGQVQMMFDAPTTLAPHVKAGKLRALSVSTAERISLLPNTPTTAEAGFPKLATTLWGGIVAPAGTPAPIVATLNQAVNADLKTDGMRASLARFALEPKTMSPQEFGAFLSSEVNKWVGVVKAAGIKPQ